MLKLKNTSIVKYQLILVFILIAALLLRLNWIDFQSLWLDELFTMADCNPDKPLSYVINRFTTDMHPPLYFILEWGWLKIFGYNDLQARLPSVLYALFGIISMFYLGKTVKDNFTGILCALFTCVNVFHIEYSQEARGYTLLFFLATLSFTFLYKIIVAHQASTKNITFWSLANLLLLYCHYYAIFLVCTQVCLILFFLFKEFKLTEIFKENLVKKVFAGFVFSGIAFSPMLIPIYNLSKIKTDSPKPTMQTIVEYFYGYFGNSTFLLWIISFLFIYTIVKLADNGFKKRQESVVIFFLIWLLTGILFPFIKSILSTPSFHIRYTIACLPAIILLLAYAVSIIQNMMLKYTLIGLFCIASVVNIYLEKRIYYVATKCDWRSTGKFMAQNNPEKYPIWDFTPEVNVLGLNYRGIHGFYIKQFGGDTSFIKQDKFLALVNEAPDKAKGLWLINSWWMPTYDGFVEILKSKGYVLIRETDNFGVHAVLYEKKEKLILR